MVKKITSKLERLVQLKGLKAYIELLNVFNLLLEMDDVSLNVTDGALAVIAKEAIKRKSGARGLRAILEARMLEVMFEIPSIPGVRECIINEKVVLNNEDPILVYEEDKKQAQSV